MDEIASWVSLHDRQMDSLVVLLFFRAKYIYHKICGRYKDITPESAWKQRPSFSSGLIPVVWSAPGFV